MQKCTKERNGGTTFEPRLKGDRGEGRLSIKESNKFNVPYEWLRRAEKI